MMNKLFTLFYLLTFLLLYGSLRSQNKDQIHIQYLYVRSPIANVYEDLYSDGKKVISKQDGNIMWTDSNYNTNKKAQDLYFISEIKAGIKNRNFFFTNFVKDNSEDYYFVLDEVPAIDWTIENDYSKKILGYDCKKATGNFRGSAVTAYFTDKIPYPIGPAKFYGLPGAILDVRADGKNYDLWKAVKIDISDQTDVDYNPQFPNFTKVNMQEFVNRKDNTNRRTMNNSTVSGSTGKVATVRLGLERVYEWEK